MAHDLSTSNKTPNAAEPGNASTSPNRRGRWFLLAGIVLVVVIIVSLVLHTAGSTSSQIVAKPTATSVPKILYQSDWSHGANGWTLLPHWSIVNGQLINDGHGGTDLLAIPYYVTAKNYTVTVNLTILSIPDFRACHSYGTEGLDGTNTVQWVGAVICIRQGTAHAGFSHLFVGHADSAKDQLVEEDYTVGSDSQTDVLTVQDKNIGFCPGPSCLPNLNSTTPLSPVHIGLIAIGVQLTISSITITTP